MNKVATKWLSGSVMALALAGGSLAVAIPAQAAGPASQSAATGGDHDNRGNDRRHDDRRDNDRRTERVCDFLDRYFDNDRKHNDSNDRWDNDTWRALERWYDRHCED